ncbi:hypothetical protein [Fulvivirga sp.]|uniref:hypothetical protein n=1 Tax=Fulvivirga sp. TaxID=1931237 RepID=UPI0032F0569B
MGILVVLFYIAVIILVLWGLLFIRWRIKLASYNLLTRKVFGGHGIKTPALKLGGSYGWTTFDLTFKTKKELDYANNHGLINLFKEKVKKRNGQGFDAELAVSAMYEGQKLWTIEPPENT